MSEQRTRAEEVTRGRTCADRGGGESIDGPLEGDDVLGGDERRATKKGDGLRASIRSARDYVCDQRVLQQCQMDSRVPRVGPACRAVSRGDHKTETPRSRRSRCLLAGAVTRPSNPSCCLLRISGVSGSTHSRGALEAVTGTRPQQARAIAKALTAQIRLATLDDEQYEDIVGEGLRLCAVNP